MKCPKCNYDMFSKYRDGGSVLICRKCPANFECDVEMPNPDWFGNKEKAMTTQATITLYKADVEKIIRKYYENAPLEIKSIFYNVDKTSDYRGEDLGYNFTGIEITTRLVI